MDSQTMLNRVMGLLAQAESTTFPEEAATFMEKAQKLMAKYSIDEAQLQERAVGTSAATQPMQMNIPLFNPHARSKHKLLHVIARANRCRVVADHGGVAEHKTGWLFGFETDVRNVMLLYTSLSIQSTKEMANATGRKSATFAGNFYDAFASAIGERLQKVNREAEAEGGNSVALVLVGREKRVDQLMAQAFPDVVYGRRGRSSQRRSTAGVDQGRQAGMRANIGGFKSGVAAGKQLPS